MKGWRGVTAAAFCTQLNPTLEEVADLKTAVSEAVTNCIIHAYEGKVSKIEMKCPSGWKRISGGYQRSWNRDRRHKKGHGTTFYDQTG